MILDPLQCEFVVKKCVNISQKKCNKKSFIIICCHQFEITSVVDLVFKLVSIKCQSIRLSTNCIRYRLIQSVFFYIDYYLTVPSSDLKFKEIFCLKIKISKAYTKLRLFKIDIVDKMSSIIENQYFAIKRNVVSDMR